MGDSLPAQVVNKMKPMYSIQIFIGLVWVVGKIYLDMSYKSGVILLGILFVITSAINFYFELMPDKNKE